MGIFGISSLPVTLFTTPLKPFNTLPSGKELKGVRRRMPRVLTDREMRLTRNYSRRVINSPKKPI